MDIISALKEFRERGNYIRRKSKKDIIYSTAPNGRFCLYYIKKDCPKFYWDSSMEGPTIFDLLQNDWEILNELPEISLNGYIE